MSKLSVPQPLIRLAKACPRPLYIVGGVCRDFWAGLTTERIDWDICAPVEADELTAVAEACGFTVLSVYKQTGTVKLKCEGEEYEYACFRSDEYVRGEHRPSKTYFTQDMTADAKRRDFCCNAVYYDIVGESFCDPLDGIPDAKNGILRTVREADRVFGEDGLRLMRLCRQAATCGFSPDRDCLQGARDNADLICDIVPERIYAEFNALLHADEKYGLADAPYRGLKLLEDTGVLDRLLPELAAGRGMEQPSAYHDYDVLEHSLRAVKYAPSDVRWAALLHDIGKPYCKIRDGNYHAHDVEGAEIAKNICRRLKMSKAMTEEISRLVRWHMYDLTGDTKENKVRRVIFENRDIFEKLTEVKQADYSACKDDLSPAPVVVRWRAIERKMTEEGVPFTLDRLAVDGNDLKALGIADHLIGVTLKDLQLACVYEPELNQREILLKRASRQKRDDT